MIPVNRPIIRNYRNKSLERCLKLKWLSGDGPIVKEFENIFSKKIGLKYGVSISNGTAALEVAISSLGLKPGSEILVPNLTIISCLNAIIKNNLKPIFIDVSKKDFNMDMNDLECKVSKKTKALIMVHTYGLASDIGKILKLKKKYGFKIIEDCAEGIGLKYNKRYIGNFGDLSTFSFYSNKLITTGEGGCILTNKKQYYNRCLSLRNLSFGKKIRFKHSEISNNYRMSSLQCAYGISEMKFFNSNIKQKIKIGNFYNEKLKDKNFLILPPEHNKTSKNIYWVYPLIVKYSKKRHFQNFLSKNHITTRDFFYPLSQQPFLKDYKIKNTVLKKSRYLYENGLYLPSGLGNTSAELKKVVKIINMYEKKYIKYKKI
jgi:perosamine synthetase